MCKAEIGMKTTLRGALVLTVSHLLVIALSFYSGLVFAKYKEVRFFLGDLMMHRHLYDAIVSEPSKAKYDAALCLYQKVLDYNELIKSLHGRKLLYLHYKDKNASLDRELERAKKISSAEGLPSFPK